MVGFRVFDVGLLIVWLVWFFRLRDDDDSSDDDGPGGGGNDPRPENGPGGGGLGNLEFDDETDYIDSTPGLAWQPLPR